MNELLSVSSVSGGKTSAYMALHYPTDKYVFAVVKTLDKNAIPKDKGLLKEAQKRIPDFIASRELDLTLARVLDLEQELGTEIKWVSSDLTYDDLILKKKTLPNFFQRFCTTDLKIKPVFEYCYNLGSLSDMVLMHIGFRSDEVNRKEKLLSQCKTAYTWKFPYKCDLQTKRNNWKTIEWRIPYFPLVENNIDHREVINFWENKGWIFPKVSNCDYCFFHKYQEHQTQLSSYPDRVSWWIEQEKRQGRTFNKKHSFEEIKDPNLSIKNTPLFSSCACTD